MGCAVITAKERAACVALGVPVGQCFDCLMALSRRNESSALAYVNGVLLAVPVCLQCAGRRDRRAGL
jgi:hypothetical protein